MLLGITFLRREAVELFDKKQLMPLQVLKPLSAIPALSAAFDISAPGFYPAIPFNHHYSVDLINLHTLLLNTKNNFIFNKLPYTASQARTTLLKDTA